MKKGKRYNFYSTPSIALHVDMRNVLINGRTEANCRSSQFEEVEKGADGQLI